MEFLLDTANLEMIKSYSECYPVTGVTSNPTILKAEGKIDFFAHMRKIRELIGPDRTLHIQVVAEDSAGILRDAEAIFEKVDEQVCIKIPVTEEGLKAMRALKARGKTVTATAIYTRIQGFLAIAAGADYLAPYFNRMENLDIDSCETIAAFRRMIDENGAKTKILAASFKNIAQVNNAFLAGSHAVTLSPPLLRDALGAAAIGRAVTAFRDDWAAIHGGVTIADL